MKFIEVFTHAATTLVPRPFFLCDNYIHHAGIYFFDCRCCIVSGGWCFRANGWLSPGVPFPFLLLDPWWQDSVLKRDYAKHELNRSFGEKNARCRAKPAGLFA